MKEDLDSKLNDLMLIVRDFAEAREWNQFHTPRNLSLALAGEVGEVAALLQWVSDEDVNRWLSVEKNMEDLQHELADVFAYLLRLADVTGIDLAKALRMKTTINELRYPIHRAKGSAQKYSNYE